MAEAKLGGAGFVATLAVSMGIGPLLIYGLTATGPLVIADLGLSRAQFGSFATVAFLAAAVSSGVLGRLVDLYSERTTMAVLYVGSAAALLLASVAQSYVGVLLAVVVSGCVQALSNPVTNRLVSRYAAPQGRGLLMGVKQSGVQMAQLTAGVALPTLALVAGWRGAVGAAAVIAGVGLLLAWRFVPHLPTRAADSAGPGSAVAVPRAVWWLTSYALLTGAALQASNVYLPLYGYEELHLSVATAGLTAAVVGGVGLVARVGWGQLADRLASPRTPLLLLALVAGLGAMFIYLAGELSAVWLLWTGAAVFGATGIASNVVLMIAVLRLSPAQLIGRASGLLAIGLYLGFALGPVTFGAVVDATSSYQVGWVGVAATYAAAAVLVLAGRFRLPTTSPPPPADVSPDPVRSTRAIPADLKGLSCSPRKTTSS